MSENINVEHGADTTNTIPSTDAQTPTVVAGARGPVGATGAQGPVGPAGPAAPTASPQNDRFIEILAIIVVVFVFGFVTAITFLPVRNQRFADILISSMVTVLIMVLGRWFTSSASSDKKTDIIKSMNDNQTSNP